MIAEVINKIKIFYGRINNVPRFIWKQVRIDNNAIIYGHIKVYGPRNRISFGRNCILRSNISSNPLGGATQIVLCVRGKNGEIRCGNNIGISNTCIRVTQKLVIEDNVNIGGDCKIYDSDMHSVDYSERMNTPDCTVREAPITIKEGAWIGAHSIILKGVTVGTKSVIGAGSVVTKSIPDNELWAGNPARFIRKINIADNR